MLLEDILFCILIVKMQYISRYNLQMIRNCLLLLEDILFCNIFVLSLKYNIKN